MEPPPEEVASDTSHVDWSFLPPPAMLVVGKFLPSSSLLRARIVNRHWASCLAGVVDTLYVVPEFFLTEDNSKEVHRSFPMAKTVQLDLQDTFMAVPLNVKESLDRYAAQRGGQLLQRPNQGPSESGGSAAEGVDQVAGAAAGGARGVADGPEGQQQGVVQQQGEQPQQEQPQQEQPQQQAEAGQQEEVQPQEQPPAQQQPQVEPPQQPEPAQQAQQAQQEQPQPQHPIAALAAAVAAGLLPQAAVAAVPPAAAALPPPAPTFKMSAVPVEPLPGLIPPGATHLRLRLPDPADISAHFADMGTSWDYVSSLLSTVGTKLSGLSLSTAPDAAHISMLAPLTQLTSLTMDEASHSTWSAEHLPIVGSLTALRNLAIKIPPFRSSRIEPGPGGQQVPQPQQPPALASWTALQQLTKLHVSALRYSFHSSLVAVLPHLTKLEYLALRAPQTRLPWPGTDKPLFANIGRLTGLTQLSLALGDHNMVPQDWQSLTTLVRISAIELSVSEGSDGLNVPLGVDFPSLRALKLRYPNSQDLVRIATWTGIQKLDIKFPEHEREWHQEDAVVELMDIRARLPPTAGTAVITSVLDNPPAQPGGSADVRTGSGAAGGQLPSQPPMGAGNTAGLVAWWSPLLPLLALPNMADFRCSAKEGLASRDPILFDNILSGMCAAWPAVTRLCFKGCITVASQTAGWDSMQALTKLQQLELRHHPPSDEAQPAAQVAVDRNGRNRFVRVEPIKLPATSLPNSLQTLLLENVELRRKETDCLVNLTSLERRTTCRHFPEFEGMPLQRLVVSNCCVKAKGIQSIASECAGLTHLVFAVYKVAEPNDLKELQGALSLMVKQLSQLQVLKVRVLAGCITQGLVEEMVEHLRHLQRLKLTSSDGWADTALFLPLTRMSGLRKCSLAYFKSLESARLLRSEFRTMLPYCKIKAKHEP